MNSNPQNAQNPQTITELKSALKQLVDLQNEIANQTEKLQPIIDQISMWERISKPEYINSEQCMKDFSKSRKMTDFVKTTDVIKRNLRTQLDTIQKINLG